MAHFVTKDGCRIHYEVKGEGEPVIFVHGWACNSKFFQYQIPAFSEKYQVITYDLRGHGESDRSSITEMNMTLDAFARDLRGLIEHLELDEVNLCGWSMGTSVLLNYVKLFGNDKLKSLCFIDMTPKLLADDDWQLGQSKVFNLKNNLEFMNVIATNWPIACAVFTPNIFAKGYDQESELFKWAMQQAGDNVPHCMLNMWIAMAVNDYRDVLPSIEVPTFLAYSGDGMLYFPEHGEYMRDHITNATLDIFPGCGHGLFLEDPEKFNGDYMAFIDALYQ